MQKPRSRKILQVYFLEFLNENIFTSVKTGTHPSPKTGHVCDVGTGTSLSLYFANKANDKCVYVLCF